MQFIIYTSVFTITFQDKLKSKLAFSMNAQSISHNMAYMYIRVCTKIKAKICIRYSHGTKKYIFLIRYTRTY